MSEHSPFETQSTQQTSHWSETPQGDFSSRYNELKLKEATGQKLNRSEKKELFGIRKISSEMAGSLAMAQTVQLGEAQRAENLAEQFAMGGRVTEEGKFEAMEGADTLEGVQARRKMGDQLQYTASQAQELAAQYGNQAETYARMSTPAEAPKTEAPSTSPWDSAPPTSPGPNPWT